MKRNAILPILYALLGVLHLGALPSEANVDISQRTLKLQPEADTDGDGVGNNTDTDDDGDGISDTDDLFPLISNVQKTGAAGRAGFSVPEQVKVLETK